MIDRLHCMLRVVKLPQRSRCEIRSAGLLDA